MSALAGLPARLRAGVWAARGRRRLADGALGEAEACCRKALGLCENHTEAYALLTRVLMPGDDYLDVEILKDTPGLLPNDPGRIEDAVSLGVR